MCLSPLYFDVLVLCIIIIIYKVQSLRALGLICLAIDWLRTVFLNKSIYYAQTKSGYKCNKIHAKTFLFAFAAKIISLT